MSVVERKPEQQSMGTTRSEKFFSRGFPLAVRAVITVVVPVLLILLSFTWKSSQVHLASEIAIWAMVAVGVNIIIGYAGQLSFASSAFMGIGAYFGARATGYWDWPGLATIAAAVLIAMVIAWALGLVIFRARGMTFALLTTGIARVATSIMINWSDFTGGSGGISTGGPLSEGGLPKPLDLGFIAIDDERQYFGLFAIVLCAMLFVLTITMRRKTGEMWKATREDEVLAASIGANVLRSKQSAFIVSSGLLALVGVLYAHWASFISPETFTFTKASFEPLAMVMIGGSGTILGPVVGASLMVSVPELFRGAQSFTTLIFGAILLIVVLVAPKGIVGLLKQWVSAIERVLRTRRRADAPGTTRREG